MDIYTFLYLADRVDAISLFCSIIGFIGSIFFTLITIAFWLNYSDTLLSKILLTITTFIFYALGITGLFIPTSDFMYQAGAVYLGKEVIKNEQIQETFNKVKKVIDLNLDKQIKELSGDKTDGT